MLPFLFDDSFIGGRRPTVLAIGAHSDDIEIGCGGTLQHLAERYPQLEVVWVVLSGTEERAAEAYAGAQEFLEKVESPRIIVKSFRDAFLAHEGEEVKETFERLKTLVEPDLIFTHRSGDSHQDHRFVCELTWQTFRDNVILEYEIPKYDGQLTAPNVYVPITEQTAEWKAKALMRLFKTQHHRSWFTEDLFLAMMRLRGIESNSPTRFAEAFTCRKVVLDLANTTVAAAQPVQVPRLVSA